MNDGPKALDGLFDTFTRSAWRLEVRSSYGAPSADRPFQQFLEGTSVELAWFKPWLDLVRRLTGQGKRIERVRIVDQPPSDYLRWEYWLNQFNRDAGEDIRYLPRRVAENLCLPFYDFWIFDERRIAFMQFSGDGEFTGPVVVEDPAVLRQHSVFRRTAWDQAVPYERYRL